MAIPDNLLDREYMTQQLIESKKLDVDLSKDRTLVEKYAEYYKLAQENPAKKLISEIISYKIEAYADNFNVIYLSRNVRTKKIYSFTIMAVDGF